MNDPLIELIYDIDHNGIRWISMLTLYALYRKEKRNYRLDLRDDALFQNLKIIMEERGREQCFVENPNSKKNLEQELLEYLRTILSPAHFTMLFTHLRVTKKSISRRKRTMIFLKSSISKKLFTILMGVAVTALNNKFNLDLSENDIYIMFAGIITYIVGQSHVDAKKAIANTVKAISVGVQAAVPNIEPMPDISYAELVPTIQNVHDGINKLLKDARLNDNSQAFKDASQAYFAIMDIIQKFKQPDPLPIIPDEQVSA